MASLPARKQNINISWPDLIAGLSIAGLLLPEAVAYSSIANLPPQTGVIALFAGLLCYGLFGSSRFAIVSATSSSAAVMAAAITAMTAAMANGDPQLRMTLAIGLVMVTGLFFLLAGLLRLGGITAFIAKPVLRGFAFGLALVIIVKQFASMVNVHPVHNDMLRYVGALLEQSEHWNWIAVAVGALALALLFLFSRISYCRYLPGGLIVIVLGVAAEKWLNLSQHGVQLVGTIPLQLVMPSLPLLSYSDWMNLGELAIAMVMILYAESYGSIRSFAMKHGDTVDPDRDLLAIGAANLLSGMFHGMPVGAGYSATSANEAAGATSRLAGWVAALVVLLIVLTLLPFIALTPQPVLAAVVIHAVSHTLNPAIFRPYFTWRRDRLLVVTAVIAVLALGVLNGLLVAIGMSLLLMLRQLSASSIMILGRLGDSHDFVNLKTHPTAKALPGILILRPNEPLFFANAERILSQARQEINAAVPPVQNIIISLEESPDLDSSSIEALTDFCHAIGSNKRIVLTRLKDPVLEILQKVDPPILPQESLSGLSVDEAVRVMLRGQSVC
ncbi:SulP family inorganic anion transporter [Glaciimonas soli]|uniref:STAS domain-containing protein n=1 Tax=Glaciimonas soli TaxID=2590999 RepID=A0A843YVR5_9BURK|nr:SulP family inorganic anion transporter [Glaciimonas soli]MQR01783.1 STAS domain-containing protein [Glaciimonas soli]